MEKVLNNVPIKFKVLGISAILLSLMIMVAAYSLMAMSQIGKEIHAITSQDIPITKNLTSVTEHQLEQAIHFERAVRYGELMQRNGEAEGKFESEIAYFDALSQKVDEELQTARNLTEQAAASGHNQKEISEFKHLNQSLSHISIEHHDFEQHAHQFFAWLKEGKIQQAETLVAKVEEEEDQLTKKLEALLAEIEGFTEEAGIRAEEHEKSAASLLAVLFGISCVVGILLSWLMASNIARRLGRATNSLGVIASGDLTQSNRIDGKDEIGLLQTAMNKMQENLLAMLTEINNTTDQLSTAAEEVSVVTRQTNANIQIQQTEMEQIATAMNEMNATVQDVAKNIGNTSKAADSANSTAINSHKDIEGTINGVKQLSAQIDSASEVISHLENDSKNINTVLEVIKGIAEQTNLLALNAAIEAARAGEQGRGFAVVADEVRTLAGRTQDSTAEINKIIEGLHDNSHRAVEAIKLSSEQALAVAEQAGVAVSAIDSIEKSVAEIDDMSSQIATAAEEQSAVTEDMSRNITQVSDMTAENATGAMQTAQAGEELAQMSIVLRDLVNRFKV